MILLDLKTTLFVVLVLATLTITVWWHRRQRSSANDLVLLEQLGSALPFGLVRVQTDGVLQPINSEGSRLLTALMSASGEQNQQALLGMFTSAEQARSGSVTGPLALRWYGMTVGNETLLLLVDTSEQQKALQQQQAFVGQLSHELRTPLTALVAHAAIARSAETPDATRAASLQMLEGQAERMARLIQGLLEIHRVEMIDELPLQPINLLLVAEQAVGQFIDQIERKNVYFTLDAHEPLPFVFAHPDRMMQVFVNLLDNAVKYCRPGDAISVSFTPQEQGVRCCIRDSGPGINPVDLPRVTQRLYRARNDVEGNGIGLALVSEILRHHHTSLVIESSIEPAHSGTTLCWTLTRAVDPSPRVGR